MKPHLNAQTIAAIQRQRQMGLGWRYDGLGDWKTEAIFAKLHELDIDTDPNRFADVLSQADPDRAASYQGDLPFQTVSKIGVNAPCPCGSGKKYKKCCKQ